MSEIHSGMRLQRFAVKSSKDLFLVIMLTSGEKIEFRVSDASLTGLSTEISLDTDLKQIEADHIVPESKLVWDESECALGRLVIVRVEEGNASNKVAFSCIDARLPLGSYLAECFDELSAQEGEPYKFELTTKKFSLADFAESSFIHPDLFERCRRFDDFLKDAKRNKLYQFYSIKSGKSGARATFKLSNSNKSVDSVSFASYDYLGYSDRPEIKEAAIKAMEKYGVSASGSMILSGKTDLHQELEERLAKLFGKEDCHLFQSGFAANVGTITGLMTMDDLIVSDVYAHASLQDGIAGSQSITKFFRHNDFESMEKILAKYRQDAQGALLITEGLYSMEGHTPDLIKFVNIAQKYNCRTFIDECHSIGVYGPRFLGVADRDDVLEEIDIFMGSFSKGLGVGAVGFICSTKEVCNWLRYFARSGMFSGALPPAPVAAAIEVTKLMTSDFSASEKLRENIDAFNLGLKKIGLATPADPQSPIIPVVVNSEEKLGKMNAILLENGIYTNCILYPAVPKGQARFRFSITAQHSASDIQLCINALKQAINQVDTDLKAG